MAHLIAIGYPDEATAVEAQREAERLAHDLLIQPDATWIFIDGKAGTSQPGTFTDAQASTIQAAVPVPLFATRIGPAVLPVARQQYSVSPDGQRFLMNVITGEDKTMPITVVLNSKDLQN